LSERRSKPLFDNLTPPKKNRQVTTERHREAMAWSKTGRGLLQDIADIIMEFISQ
jgi:hypothetical protein